MGDGSRKQGTDEPGQQPGSSAASVARIRGDVQPRHRPCSDLVALPKRNRFADLKAAVTVLWAGEPRA